MRFVRRSLLGFIIFVVAMAASAFIVRKRVPQFGESEDDAFSLVTAMGGIAFESRAKALTEGALFVYMGGAELDLMDAELATDAHLSLKVFMGGVSVVVPPTWRVEVRQDVKMGEVANKTNPDDPEDGPLLVIDVKVVMGGVEIQEGDVD
jgi:hypothetical protein